MNNEELIKRLDTIEELAKNNSKGIKNNAKDIKDNFTRIQQNSGALDVLKDLKKVNKRLEYIILIEAIIFAIVFIIFHL